MNNTEQSCNTCKTNDKCAEYKRYGVAYQPNCWNIKNKEKEFETPVN